MRTKHKIMRSFYPLLVLALAGCAAPQPQIASNYSMPAMIRLTNLQITNGVCTTFFEVKNISDQPLWYSSKESGILVYIVERKRSIGGWDELPDNDEYEFGQGRLALAPGQSTNFDITFKIPPNSGIQFRVGVRLSPYEDEPLDLSGWEYWTDTIYP